ncbi:hypothetical protein ACHHYP_00674 [Achlya hypogyna]|uniref:Uncharacterized protein n=1 Tax=Achlya hypogyna TaxID=1202772 RepID=A0A1V9ZU80_ACHHY|nr:hypothetical protein ACHHYP_00674 [Achlya hypogyna]
MQGTLVKDKSSSRLLRTLADWNETYGLRDKFNALLVAVAYVIGLIVVVLVAIDAFANNWAIIDFIGNGNEFITPVANVLDASDLATYYTFPSKGMGLKHLSSVGTWMINYTVTNLGLLGTNIYLLSTAAFRADATVAYVCTKFNGEYPVDLDRSRVIQLASVADSITFLRGNAFSIALTDTATVNRANSSMGSAQLLALGYLPGRIETDLRLTQRITLRNSSSMQAQLVPFYRIYAKGYCTGCTPIAELGHSTCNFSMIYSDTNKTLLVRAEKLANTVYRQGLLIQRSSFSTASHYIKFIAMFFALAGFLASRRTVQWNEVDPTKPDSVFARVMRTVVPKCFPHSSHALRFDMFCYNSDLFVTLFCISIALDMNGCLIFIREVNVYNKVAPQFMMSVRLFALSLRLLWLNCGILKVFKICLSIVSTATYCGESKLMGFLNLTSVTSLYLSAILLFYVPNYIEYNNSVRQDLNNDVESLDGTPVSFYNSFYFRVAYAVAFGLVVNILFVTAVDQVFNRAFWKLLARNSLGRQALFNSTSILCDYIADVHPDRKNKASLIVCKARRLSTLQWFFTSHMFTFGLPEKELRVKKNNKGATAPTTTSSDAATGPGKETCLVVQDSNGQIHLLDDQLSDVKSLVYNIKALLLKSKSQTILGRLNEVYGLRDKFNRLLVFVAYIVGLAVVVLVTIDAFANNWSLVNFIGDANEFITPVANVANASTLTKTYTFPMVSNRLSKLSSIGLWMVNYSVTNLGLLGTNIYLITTSTFAAPDNIAGTCGAFANTYSVDLSSSATLKLATVFDSITFLRGNALSIALTDTATAHLANSSMGSAQLMGLGYLPSRIQVDLLMTQQIALRNTTVAQTLVVPFYRIYTKGYCTGCKPIAVVAHSICNFTMVYSDVKKTLRVTTGPLATAAYRLGIMVQQNAFSTASTYIKFIALFLAFAGFLASRRTVQWSEADPTKSVTIFARVVQTFTPKCFPHSSHALRFDMFCYNSDLFVILYCASVLLDINYSLLYIREVNVFNSIDGQAWMSVRLFALSLRLLWLNCGILKLTKLALSIMSTATYCGESKVMGYINLTSVTSLYLSAILLFYVPPYIEYNNSVRHDLKNSVECLDGIPVSFYNSFYFRVAYAVVLGLIANIFLVTAVDQVFNRPYWKLLARNSLTRQALFNSTSIFCDFISDVHEDRKHKNVLLVCKARRLSTLQWYFMNHLITFGLPEKELRAKKYITATTSTSGGGNGSGKETCLVVQDSNHHVHLLDDQLADVQSLVYNIKVLRDTTTLLGQLNETYKLRDKFNHGLVLVAYAVGLLVVLLVAIDAISNNWALIDFIGDGNDFITPVANVANASDLVNHYTFRPERSLATVSSVGLWMLNYAVTNLGLLGNNIYLLNTGTYTTVPETPDICARFTGAYPIDIAKGNPVKLAVALDLITFLRGNALSIAFTDTSTANLANRTMGSAALNALGYEAARIAADLRLSQQILLLNTTALQIQAVPVYEIYPKGYCTGCTPIAELGHGICNFTMLYDDARKSLTVNSTGILGSPRRHGLMIQQNAFSAASHYLKFIALFLAVAGYLASRRTVQWNEPDPTKPDTIFARAIQIFAPKCFPHSSHALRFDMFCYNSDLFVVLYCLSVILDFSASLIFIREVNVYNSLDPQFNMSVRLFALSLRLLWINCGILKLTKLGLSVVSTATYSGESKVMGYINLTSVTSLYLSAILLFYVPPYIEYNNSVRQDLYNLVESLDGTPVDFYSSFYFRVSYAVIMGLIANIFLVTAVDQFFNRAYWKLLVRNSLTRQALFNSTSILCDFISDVHEDRKHKNVLLVCKARRLSTLQWFFTSHLFTFGLPEKELRAKKYQTTAPTTTTSDATGPGKETCIVVQDGNCQIHLLDDQLADVKSLVYNIKVLKDTTVVIK